MRFRPEVIAFSLIAGTAACTAEAPLPQDGHQWSDSQPETSPSTPPKPPQESAPSLPRQAPESPTGHVWVEAEVDGEKDECYIDMSHILDGYVVIDSLKPTDGTPCDVDAIVDPEDLPEDYNDVLENKREAWDNLIADSKELVEEHYSDNGWEEISNDIGWVDTVGMVPMSQGYLWFYDGSDPNDDGYDDRQYGAGSCLISESVIDGPAQIRRLGKVTYLSQTFDLAIFGNEGSPGTPCDPGDLILLPDGSADGGSGEGNSTPSPEKQTTAI